ncbi:MAG: penicillin-binding protein [Streptococcaceae bacterium]|nr:penicillin-binding protein [Streptococcaceae bacterium]
MKNRKLKKIKFKLSNRMKKVLTVIGLFFFAIVTVIALFSAWYLNKESQEARTLTLNMGTEKIVQSFTILDKNGQPLVSGAGHLKFQPAYLSGNDKNIPDIYKNSLVAVEDNSFYTRTTKGFSINGLFNAGFSQVLYKMHLVNGVRGGSTIDQQVVKNVTLGGSNADSTLSRKAIELIDAHVMAKKYSRDDILTSYIDSLRLTNGTIGVNAAWNSLFSSQFNQNSKEPLYLAQIAYVVGLGQSPSDYVINFDTHGKDRAIVVLGVMKDKGIITSKEYDDAVQAVKTKLKLENRDLQGVPVAYQPYVSQVQNEVSQLFLPANADVVIKTYADKGQLDQLNEIAHQNLPNAQRVSNDTMEPGLLTAISVVDTKTGHILGLATNSENPLLPVSSERSSGSTIKPLLDYAPALEYGYISTGSTMNGNATQYAGGAPLNNYGGVNYGPVNVGFALGASLNSAALQAFNMTTDEQKNSIMRPLGLSQPSYNQTDSISYNISTLEEASAYSALGNDGVRVQPTAIESITVNGQNLTLDKPTSQRAMSSSTARNLTSLLQNVTLANGSEPLAAQPQWAGGFATKSGLSNFPDTASEPARSNGSPDAWMAATTTGVSTSVWLGSPDMSGKYYITATPIEAENNMRVYLLNNTLAVMNNGLNITPFQYTGQPMSHDVTTGFKLPTLTPFDNNALSDLKGFNPKPPTVPQDLTDYYNQHQNDQILDKSKVFGAK